MHTSLSRSAFVAVLAVLLVAGCASSENASSEKKDALDGQPVYEEDEVDRPPTPRSPPRFQLSFSGTSGAPPELRDARVGFVVNTEGEPVRIRMVRSTGNYGADRSIQRGIEKQRYVPGVLDGEAVPVHMTQDFNFN